VRDGVRITKLGPGKFKDAGLKEGFVITHLNYKAIRSIDDVLKLFATAVPLPWWKEFRPKG
jgi:hypothetical protein